MTAAQFNQSQGIGEYSFMETPTQYEYLFKCSVHGIFASNIIGSIKDQPKSTKCIHKSNCEEQAVAYGFQPV